MCKNKIYHKNTFWKKNFIEDVTMHYNENKVGELLWCDDENAILKQVEELSKREYDLILSEILPHELPDIILPFEINKIAPTLQYIPPQIIEQESKEKRRGEITKIIYDAKSENKRLYEIFGNNDKIIAKDLKQENDIFEVINNEDKFVLIDIENPYISHFLIMHCIKNEINFKISNVNNSLYIRCILSGLFIKEDLINAKSNRSLFHEINNNSVYHEIFDLNITEKILNFKNWHDFIRIKENSFYRDITEYRYTSNTPLFDTTEDDNKERYLEINFPDNAKFYFHKSVNSIQYNYYDIKHLQNHTGYRFLHDFIPDNESFVSEYRFSVFLQKYPSKFKYFIDTIIKNYPNLETNLKSPIHFLIKCSILSSKIDSNSQNYNYFYHEYINIAQRLETKDSRYRLYSDLSHFFKLDDRSIKILKDTLSKPQTPFIDYFLYILPSVIGRRKCYDFISQFKFNKSQEYFITLGVLRAFGFWQDKSNAVLNNKELLIDCFLLCKNLKFKNFHTFLLSALLDMPEDLNEANQVLNTDEKIHLIYNLNRFGKDRLFIEFLNLFSKDDEFNLSLSNNICSLSLLNVSEVHKDVKDYIENFDIDKYMATEFTETNYYYLSYLTYFSKHRSHQNYLFFKRLSNKYYRSNFNYVPS